MNTIAAPLNAGATWWQPQSAARRVPASLTGSRTAFLALVFFTCVLLLSPQAWFPILKVIRIALLAAGIAMAAHVFERTALQQPITPMAPEIGIALALIAWSVITIPLSYWPTGSLKLLTDQYLKAIAFFWLLGTIVTSTDRLRAMAWTLVLCSVPLAATGVANYLSGATLSTGVRGFYRIEGYVGSGGSGLTGNPNDLALMLNLIVPLAGVLAFVSRGTRRLVAIAALLLAVLAIVLTFSRAGKRRVPQPRCWRSWSVSRRCFRLATSIGSARSPTSSRTGPARRRAAGAISRKPRRWSPRTLSSARASATTSWR